VAALFVMATNKTMTYEKDVAGRCSMIDLYSSILVINLLLLTVANLVSVDTVFSVWIGTSMLSCILTYVRTGRPY
jgi:hypothetical protein